MDEKARQMGGKEPRHGVRYGEKNAEIFQMMSQGADDQIHVHAEMHTRPYCTVCGTVYKSETIEEAVKPMHRLTD